MRVYTDAARDDEYSAMAWEIHVEGETYTGSRWLDGHYTSMEAEYFALLDGLRMAKRYGNGDVEIYCDCRPLVEKMRVPDGYNETWYQRRVGCHRLLNKFDDWELNWTPRSTNTEADRLAYEALEDARQS